MKSQVMKKAWELFKKETRRFPDMKTMQFWASCLRIAWKSVKQANEPKKANVVKINFGAANKNQKKMDEFYGGFWWYQTIRNLGYSVEYNFEDKVYYVSPLNRLPYTLQQMKDLARELQENPQTAEEYLQELLQEGAWAAI